MTTATIGPVTLKGVYNVSDDGGMQSPDMTVDKSFDYSSYVQRQPVEASVTALVNVQNVKSLRKLRQQKQPVGFSAGQVSIKTVKITNLSIDDNAEQRTHVEARIDVKEVFTASVETTSAVVELPGGGSVSGGDSDLPALVDSESDSEGGSGPPSDSQSSPSFVSDDSSQSASDSPTGNDSGGDGGIFDSAVSAVDNAIDDTANALASVTPGDGII